MPVVLWVALGGGIGAAARHGVNVWSGRMFGTDFPWQRSSSMSRAAS